MENEIESPNTFQQSTSLLSSQLGAERFRHIVEGNVLLLNGHLAHLDEVLSDFGDPLLALVDGEIGPIYELLFDLRERIQHEPIG